MLIPTDWILRSSIWQEEGRLAEAFRITPDDFKPQGDTANTYYGMPM